MLSQRCIKCSEEFGAEECEVPLEDDGTLLLSTLQSVFPGAKGKRKFSPKNFHVKLNFNFSQA
jgi:Transactive response DNA-binding protein N-terminal domain